MKKQTEKEIKKLNKSDLIALVGRLYSEVDDADSELGKARNANDELQSQFDDAAYRLKGFEAATDDLRAAINAACAMKWPEFWQEHRDGPHIGVVQNEKEPEAFLLLMHIMRLTDRAGAPKSKGLLAVNGERSW